MAAIALVLYRLRVILVLAGIGATVWLASVVLDTGVRSNAALLPLTLLLWTVLGLAGANTLSRLPTPVRRGDAFRLRIKKRLLQIGYAIGLLAMLAATGLVLLLSWRALGLWMSG